MLAESIRSLPIGPHDLDEVEATQFIVIALFGQGINVIEECAGLLLAHVAGRSPEFWRI